MVVTFHVNNQKIMLMTTTTEKVFIHLCYKVLLLLNIKHIFEKLIFIELITSYYRYLRSSYKVYRLFYWSTWKNARCTDI